MVFFESPSKDCKTKKKTLTTATKKKRRSHLVTCFPRRSPSCKNEARDSHATSSEIVLIMKCRLPPKKHSFLCRATAGVSTSAVRALNREPHRRTTHQSTFAQWSRAVQPFDLLRGKHPTPGRTAAAPSPFLCQFQTAIRNSSRRSRSSTRQDMGACEEFEPAQSSTFA